MTTLSHVQELQSAESGKVPLRQPLPSGSHGTMAASRFSPRSRASLAAHHVLGAETGSTPTWKLVALAAASGAVGYYVGHKKKKR
jgi:hypothetical protein